MTNDRLNNIVDLVPEIVRIEQKLREMVLVTETKTRDNGDYPFNIPFITKSDIYSAFNSTFPSFIENSIDGDTTVEPVVRESLDVPEVCVAETENTMKNRAYSHRLQALKSAFRLSAFEVDTLLLCLLPELDSEYQKLLGYLQDDITQKLPTLNFVLQLLCSSFNERIHARHSFLPDSPLLKYKLIELSEEYTGKKSPLITNSLMIDQRIVNYLLGIDTLDSRISFFTEVNRETQKLDDVVLSDDVKKILVNCIKLSSNNDLIFSFFGNKGVGKNTTVRAVCNESGLPLLVVDINRMLSTVIPGENLIPLVFREGLLRNAAINFNGLHLLIDTDKGSSSLYNVLIDELIKYPHIIFVTGERIWEPGHELRRKRVFTIEFTVPSFRDRKTLWQKYCEEETRLDDKVDINDLAGKFQFTGSQILNAAIAARDLATLRGSDTEPVTVQDIYTASRRQSKHNLSRLARKIYPKYTWNDIILQTDQAKQLREICNQVKHYYTVYDEWGFSRKLSLGQGLNVLFAGPSGTGKTMAAEIIAGELGLDLYRIDLSAIVSKYIGETEKNLDQVFNEGRTSNAILFFDEADALFGKRSEVRDSHDRYANVEISYLLQKMDEYDGIVILATNLRKNMDDAFARRLHFSLEFPVPDEPDRYLIWKYIFPAETPLSDEIDLHFMARQFKITGGNIKNIALGAAFLAAEDSCRIRTEHLIQATKREYQKLGKLCTEGEFGEYFWLVKREIRDTAG